MALATSNAALVDRFRERLGDADDGVRMTALEGTGAIMQSAIQGRQIDANWISFAADGRPKICWVHEVDWVGLGMNIIIIDVDTTLWKSAPATLSLVGPAWILVAFEAGTVPPGSLAGEVADLRPTVVAAESLRERLADRCLDPNDAIRLRAVEIITEVALASEAQPKSGISRTFWGLLVRGELFAARQTRRLAYSIIYVTISKYKS